MKILDIGCGRNKQKGAVGIDFHPASKADIKHNLNVFPWPLEDNSIDTVLAYNILEHLDDIPKTMDEIWRISRAGAILEIIVPFASSRWLHADPTHKRGFISSSLDFFITGSQYYGKIFTKAKFKRMEVEYTKDSDKIRWSDKLFLRLANKYKNYYETYFMYIYQIPTIYFKLKVVKN